MNGMIYEASVSEIQNASKYGIFNKEYEKFYGEGDSPLRIPFP